jgi:hypothetical protein
VQSLGDDAMDIMQTTSDRHGRGRDPGHGRHLEHRPSLTARSRLSWIVGDRAGGRAIMDRQPWVNASEATISMRSHEPPILPSPVGHQAHVEQRHMLVAVRRAFETIVVRVGGS